MIWRRLRPGETDHEILWLSVSLASLTLASLWLRFSLPLLRCPLHELTGWPCPTCGATRCVRFALGGDFGAAFGINPLAFLSLIALTLYDLYAATVLALRLPRLRLDAVPSGVGKRVRIAAVAVIAANWAWLFWRGV